MFSEDIKRQILICTPEKLSYVLHHDPFFLSAIDLFVFDEGHMFDDGGRGATYELLVTHIRQNITSEQQLVLLSAVLPNSGILHSGCLRIEVVWRQMIELYLHLNQ